MAILTRDEILACRERVRWVDVEVPEWAGADGVAPAVRIRGLTAAERDAFEREHLLRLLPDGTIDRAFLPEHVRTKLVIACAIDGENRRLFSDADLPLLNALGAVAIGRLYDAAARLSGLAGGAVEQEKNA